ncbi:MAG: prepilin-type N-terminal cleavage/methylation domain-containing protein [Armatimonadota bacterium]
MQKNSKNIKKKNKGLTLVELMIVCGVFLLLIVLSGDLFMKGWKYTRFAMPKTDQLREARRIVTDMGMDIMTSANIAMSGIDGEDGFATYTDEIALIKKFYNDTIEGEPVYMGYRITKNSEDDLHTLTKYTYGQPYDPNKLKITNSKTLSERIKYFKIIPDKENNLYTIELKVASANPDQEVVSLTTTFEGLKQ